MLTIVHASHLDHNLTLAQIRHILKVFGERTEFFIETIELPEGLGTVECGLYGPDMGDEPITGAFGDSILMVAREGRSWRSRCINKPKRQTRKLTVVAGPYKDLPCVLYTVYGGPAAPRELNDPSLPADKEAESRAYWGVHALAIGE